MLMPRSGVRRRKRPASAGSRADDSNKRTRGRPKGPVKSTRNVLDIAHTAVETQETPAVPRLSALESLPTEIIQYIFFECLEINLMAVSRTLRSVLIDKAILRSLILFAYYDPLIPSRVDRQVFKPAKFKRLEQERRQQLQRDLPRVPGFGIASLLESLPALCHLAMRKDWTVDDPRLKSQLSNRRLDDYIVDLIMCREADEHCRIFSGDEEHSQQEITKVPVSRFFRRLRDLRQELLPDREDIDDYFRILNARLFSHNSGGETSDHCGGHLPVIDVLGISPALITGTWTQERLMLVQLLRLCVQSGRESSQTCVLADLREKDIIWKALDDALEQQHITAFLTLLDLYLCAERSRGRSGRRDFYWSEQPLPLRLYQKATELGDASEEVLGILFRYDSCSFPTDFDAITKWALEQEAQGSGFGKWLLGYMRNPFPSSRMRIIDSRLYQDNYNTGVRALVLSMPMSVRPSDKGFRPDLGYDFEPVTNR
jgi:hypothetical protein